MDSRPVSFSCREGVVKFSSNPESGDFYFVYRGRNRGKYLIHPSAALNFWRAGQFLKDFSMAISLALPV